MKNERKISGRHLQAFTTPGTYGNKDGTQGKQSLKNFHSALYSFPWQGTAVNIFAPGANPFHYMLLNVVVTFHNLIN
jgi:hypothetical protein